uniref:Hydratase n=2 Tax=Arthrobacter echini TaxID=1529066 RepID=A0A5D0XVE2_9MICC|nr:hydratase [Arthrobacter echini]
MEPRIGEVESNVTELLRLGEEAVAHGAKLLVFPELCSSGYVFQSKEEVAACAEDLSDSRTISTWAAFCRANNVWMVAGYPENSGGTYFNSSVLIGPEGVIGNYRKNHLWNNENKYFEPGDCNHPVFRTELGTIGMMVCYDGWFPEAVRSFAVQGADVLCVPTNWVPIPGQAPGEKAMATILCQASAHVNGLYIVAADRVGTERGQEFIGQSVITGYTGWHLAGPASPVHQEILYAEIKPGEARDSRQWNEFNDPLLNRRVETYTTHTPA